MRNKRGPSLGDSGDDDRIFASLYSDLRRFAAVVGPVDVEPDDLVQEAVACALALGPLGDLANPGAYLRTAIVRLASNRRRSYRRRSQALARLANTLSIARLDTYPSDLDDLRRLSPADRSVLYLWVVERRSHQEIAALVGTTEASARKRLSRALQKLRSTMTPPEDSHA